MSGVQYKVTRHTKKQENMTPNEEKSIERGQDMTKMMEIADKDIKTAL